MARGSGDSNNGWRLARANFFGQRALLALFEKVARNRRSGYSQLLPDTATIDIPQDFICFSADGASRLAELVKEKSLNELEQLGGIEGIASVLETDLKNGITGDAPDVSRRKETFGSNTYDKPAVRSFFYFAWEACKDLSIIILLVCAVVTIVVGAIWQGIGEGNWLSDGVSLLIAVFVSVCVTAASNYWQNRQIKKLSKVSNSIQVDVVRNGRQQKISIFEIVVGDVVCLKTGDQVPADGLCLERCSLKVDESVLTNNSELVELNHNQNPFLISGPKVVDGCAKMLVTSVGKRTSWGEMMTKINRDSSEETPLRAKLEKLASSIAIIGFLVTCVVFVVLLVQYFTGETKDENGERAFNVGETKASAAVLAVVGIIANAVAIADVAIPENLSLANKLTLAYSLKRMMKNKASIRNKSAFETMGFTTTICVDKTGTLTLNQMEVTEIRIGQEPMELGKAHTLIAANVLELLYQGLGLNTTCSFIKLSSNPTEKKIGAKVLGLLNPRLGLDTTRNVDKSTDSRLNFELSGSPTEKAILQWAVRELQIDMDIVKQNCRILHMEAFNSEKKRSGVSMKKIVDNTIHAHWKGAPEVILAMCSHYYDRDGHIKALDNHERKIFDQIIQGMADRGLRCIAFAHKQLEIESDDGTMHQVPDKFLTLLGLVGLKDPYRPGVNKAIEECRDDDVNIIMITGDNVFTAKAVAKECGILHNDQEGDGGVVLEGEQFRDFTETEQQSKVDEIRVMARSSPSDKLLLVQCLKKKGHIVAMIGDGTNDALAIKEANVGISMGIQCTEMAKMSSDIVISHDDFASVAIVLEWGRCVYTNVQKFIQFQLAVFVSSLVINLVAVISVGEAPFTTVQLLWVGIIIERLGPLALASEKPTKELMKKPPVRRTEPLITNYMWRNLLAQAIYQIIVILTLQFKGDELIRLALQTVDDDESVLLSVQYTIMFNTFVFLQVFDEINARTLEKKNVLWRIHRNKRFLIIIGVTVILQVAMVEVEFLNQFASTVKLNFKEWGACVGFAAVSCLLGWLVKLIPVPKNPISDYFTWFPGLPSVPNNPIFRFLARIWRMGKDCISIPIPL